MNKLNIRTFVIFIFFIILTLIVNTIFKFIYLQSPENELVYNFHQQIKNEHIKVEKLSKAIKKEPNNYNLYLERANAKLKQQEIFNDFVKIFIPDTEYPILNKSDILCDLDKAERLNPNIDNDLTIGTIQYKSKDYKFAITILNDYIKNNPHNSDVYKAYYYRALCYEKLNNNEVAEMVQYNNYSNKYPINLAIQDLKKTISLNPKFAVAYTKLGDIYTSNGDAQNLALKYYDKATMLNEQDVNNYINKIAYYGFHMDDSIQKQNLLMSLYYDALKTKNSLVCLKLYSVTSLYLVGSNPQFVLQMPYKEEKSLKILINAIKNCKYYTVPNEFYEDLQFEYFNIFFDYIYNYSSVEDIDSVIYYRNKCKQVALKNNYGDFCSRIETPIDEKIKNYKLNFKSYLRFFQLSIKSNFNNY